MKIPPKILSPKDKAVWAKMTKSLQPTQASPAENLLTQAILLLVCNYWTGLKGRP